MNFYILLINLHDHTVYAILHIYVHMYFMKCDLKTTLASINKCKLYLKCLLFISCMNDCFVGVMQDVCSAEKNIYELLKVIKHKYSITKWKFLSIRSIIISFWEF